MKQLITKYKNNEISLRSLISQIKNNQEYTNNIYSQTSFLDRYNADILERIYCVIHNITDIVKCKYCDSKAKWSGRINDEYKLTCCNKECESKRISEQKTGSNKISSNRNSKFIEWQNSITIIDSIDDNFIKENIKYEKYIDLINNPYILEYLNTRYSDSYSLKETYNRIKLGIEEKPICPVCGKPVIFVGKKNKMFTTYCSNTCAGKSDNTISKKKQTQLENWGTKNCYDSDKYKSQVKEKYGVDYISQRKDVIEKRKQTYLERYGVEHISQNEEIKQKVWETTKKNLTYNTSHEEEQVYNWLIELGYNVERSYKSELYPFNCDFYIQNYDLYIEYQGSYYHNRRAYLNNTEDKKELNDYYTKAHELVLQGKNPKILGVIDTWYIRDVNKRETAYKNKINFLEIYSCISKEHLKFQIDLWVNCKNNKSDSYNIYNYLENELYEDFNKCKLLNYTIDEFKNVSKLGNSIIKYFQGKLFYAKEMEIYANNPIKRRKLIQNRIKYLNKTEHELTINDIITGFKKSGIYYGYSHFNPEWTNWFINKFNIKTVYDPCGGWGHHMLGMLSCEKIIYNDISEETCKNIQGMKDYFDIDNLEIYVGDGTEYIPENVDAFFMCPPYYNIEVYNNETVFDNIESYGEFLNKIFDIWNNNDAQIFGLIIREDYVDLIKYKYSEKYEIKLGNTHLGKKKNKEYFYIFKK